MLAFDTVWSEITRALTILRVFKGASVGHYRLDLSSCPGAENGRGQHVRGMRLSGFGSCAAPCVLIRVRGTVISLEWYRLGAVGRCRVSSSPTIPRVTSLTNSIRLRTWNFESSDETWNFTVRTRTFRETAISLFASARTRPARTCRSRLVSLTERSRQRPDCNTF